MAKVGAVYHTCVTVRIGSIHCIPKEDERCAGFHSTLHYLFHYVKGWDRNLCKSVIIFTKLISLRKLLVFLVLIVIIFQRKSHQLFNLVRIKKAEILSVYQSFHKNIRYAYSREDIMSLSSVITVIGSKVNEFIQVLMPDIEGDGSTALPSSKLVYCNCCIIVKPHPRNDSS